MTAEARAARILSRLDSLFEIGRAAGTNRPGLGAGEQQAFEQVAAWMREAGLEVEFDKVGNLYGRLPGAGSSWPRSGAARTWIRLRTAVASTAPWV